MKPYLCLLWLVLLAASISNAETLRVGTLNLRNYLLQNRYLNGSYRFDYPKPEAPKQAIREILTEADVDVLFLQEIGSPDFLLELQMDLAARGLVYPYAHCSISEDSRRGLAVLARIPPDQIIFHDPVPLTGHPGFMPRGIQEVRFSVWENHFRFFHIHLKSRYTSDPADPDSRTFRTAELNSLRQMLHSRRSLAPEREALFLVGDFNSPFSSPILEPLRQLWVPIAALDDSGQDWTYFHFKSNRHDRIDGFWYDSLKPPLSVPCGQVLPGPQDARRSGSDHRLVLIELALPRPRPLVSP